MSLTIKKFYKSVLFKIINNFVIIFFLKKINKHTTHTNCDLTLVIFSKDRPFQLRSLLLSVQKNFKGISEIFVIYKISSNSMSTRYEKLATTFKSKNINFFQEKKTFKKSLNEILSNIKTSHIIFSVDDVLVFDQIKFDDFKHIVKNNNIFSLRLGKNINFCYTSNTTQMIPENYKQHKEDIISWKISDGSYDFSYPFSLDMHVFSKNIIQIASKHLFYNTVNSYEGALNKITKYVSNWDIYSFNKSKCVNLPLNKVQNENDNKFGGLDYNDLNKDFDNNEIYDFQSIQVENINSPHQILDLRKIKIREKHI